MINWTQELEERVKTMWLANHSGGEIVEALGIPELTRSALMGKIGRLGLRRGTGGVLYPKAKKKPNKPRFTDLLDFGEYAGDFSRCHWPIDNKICGKKCGNVWCEEHEQLVYDKTRCDNLKNLWRYV